MTQCGQQQDNFVENQCQVGILSFLILNRGRSSVG